MNIFNISTYAVHKYIPFGLSKYQAHIFRWNPGHTRIISEKHRERPGVTPQLHHQRRVGLLDGLGLGFGPGALELTACAQNAQGSFGGTVRVSASEALFSRISGAKERQKNQEIAGSMGIKSTCLNSTCAPMKCLCNVQSGSIRYGSPLLLPVPHSGDGAICGAWKPPLSPAKSDPSCGSGVSPRFVVR